MQPIARSEPWTWEETDSLDARWRYELVDGRLLVSPRPVVGHDKLVKRIGRLLDDSLPEHLLALHERDVTLPYSTRIIDLVVIAADLPDSTTLLMPSQILLAVEVESPSSIGEDRIRKPAEYAAAGIPFYWVARPGTEPLITAYALDDGSTTYRQVSGPAPRAEVPFVVDLS